MADILPFRRKPEITSEPFAAGLIEIRATAEGDEISVCGAYTDRLQHGAFIALKLLNMFVDKIAASGDAGSSYSAPLMTALRYEKKKRGLPIGLQETTDMVPLELRRKT